MNETNSTKKCLNCGRSIDQVPLISIEHRDGSAYICPQCFPVLIHEPQALIGKLSGAEGLRAHEH